MPLAMVTCVMTLQEKKTKSGTAVKKFRVVHSHFFPVRQSAQRIIAKVRHAMP